MFVTVYATLTALYLGLGTWYLADPAGVLRGVSSLDRQVGGPSITAPDVAPWRYGTALGVLTLAILCLLVLIDLRRHLAVVVPLIFFKAGNAVLWFHYYGTTHLPAFRSLGFFDLGLAAVTVGAAAWGVRVLRSRPPAPIPLVTSPSGPYAAPADAEPQVAVP